MKLDLRTAGLALAGLMVACGPKPAATTTAATSGAVETGAPTAARQWTISGKVVGHDGQRLPVAHAHLGDQSVAVDDGGHYTLTTSAPGFNRVLFTAPDHVDYAAGIWVDDADQAVGVDVQLGTYPVVTELADVQVLLVDMPAGQLAVTGREPMVRRDDGTFALELVPESDRVMYELLGVVAGGGRSVNGTRSDELLYDGDGNYVSVVSVEPGKPYTLVFDPAAFPPSDRPTQLSFADTGGRGARIASIHAGVVQRERALTDAIIAAQGQGDVDMATLVDKSWRPQVAHDIEAEPDAVVRAALLVAYFSQPSFGDGYGVGDSAAVDRALAERLLAEVPADSTLWAMAPAGAVTAVALTEDPATHDEYLDTLILSRADREQGANLLLNRLWQADAAGREADVARFYDMMRTKFGDTMAARSAARFNPARKIRPGKRIPEFSLTSADRPGVTFTNETFAGQTVLIEFWATWCGPCVAEMPGMHRAYQAYKDKKFTILSINVDDSAEAARRFRKDKFPMPWNNVILEGEQTAAVKAAFEVSALPTTILVDATGKIVATDNDLRGRHLMSTLGRVLGEPDGVTAQR